MKKSKLLILPFLCLFAVFSSCNEKCFETVVVPLENEKWWEADSMVLS